MPTIPSSTTEEAEKQLKPYRDHGVDLTREGTEGKADCPFCGKPKFSVSLETGQWRCFTCGGGRDNGGGGILDFLETFWQEADKLTTSDDYTALAQDRGLEFPETIMSWQLVKSPLTDNWLIPGWGINIQGKVEFQQLYRYTSIGGRMLLLPTTGRKHTLLGLNLWNASTPEVYVCEGPWDAIRMWEAVNTLKVGDQGNYVPTASGGSSSLIKTVSVLGAATCSSFPPERTSKWFNKKVVTFFYDSDYPGTNRVTGAPTAPAGLAGLKRDVLKVVEAASAIRYMHWGDNGYDPDMKDGYDVRDALREKASGLLSLLRATRPVPDEWLQRSSEQSRGGEVECRPCSQWTTLITAWRKAMKWTPGLEHALSCGLASIASTKSVGDQLWFKIIGPASCGKSTIAEAFGVNKKYTVSKSTIRGFHSGFKADGSGTDEDNGLIPQIRGKTLLTKDGDTLLQSPNVGQILAEARDLYDGVSRTHYRNKMSKDYEGVRMTWLLFGTSSLRAIDKSELGERFLDCVLMQRIDAELEDEILDRKVNQAADQAGLEANGDAISHYAPELLNAMELTGGYIDWLRDNAGELVPKIEFHRDARAQVIAIGKFVAFMRARPSDIQSEEAERELAARLVSVHARLAKFLSLVINKKEVDAEIIARVRQIGLDTGRGVVYNITTMLYKVGGRGMTYKALEMRTPLLPIECKRMVQFLKMIGVCTEKTNSEGIVVQVLTQRMYDLYTKVVGVVE